MGYGVSGKMRKKWIKNAKNKIKRFVIKVF